jgi:hypothetical protein
VRGRSKGRKTNIEDLGEPTEPIILTEVERRMLKQVVFRNLFTMLDPVYRKVADKEVNAINKVVGKGIANNETEFGAPKSCE